MRRTCVDLWSVALCLFGSCVASVSAIAQDSCNGAAHRDSETDARPGESVRVEQGKRRPIIDGIGWVMGIPSKILLWDRRAENHSVSDGTVAEVTHYLEHQGLNDTMVRVNQYAPIDEFRRLTQNRKVGAGWRYTVGTLHWVGYTIVPGRIFGGDRYNPYTDSVYVYSDMPSLGLASAAYAKDVDRRALPGTYAAFQDLPGVNLWHETIATREAMSYAMDHGTSESPSKIRRDLYARYGMVTGGAVEQFVPAGGLITVVGAGSGHLVAGAKNRQAIQENDDDSARR